MQSAILNSQPADSAKAKEDRAVAAAVANYLLSVRAR
jgi:hypothetical protein